MTEHEAPATGAGLTHPVRQFCVIAELATGAATDANGVGVAVLLLTHGDGFGNLLTSLFTDSPHGFDEMVEHVAALPGFRDGDLVRVESVKPWLFRVCRPEGIPTASASYAGMKAYVSAGVTA
jgi:hypothetical protein